MWKFRVLNLWKVRKQRPEPILKPRSVWLTNIIHGATVIHKNLWEVPAICVSLHYWEYVVLKAFCQVTMNLNIPTCLATAIPNNNGFFPFTSQINCLLLSDPQLKPSWALGF